MRDILKYLITSIVDKPEAVEILEEENQGIVNLTVKVDPQDMGKVIGKEGKLYEMFFEFRQSCRIKKYISTFPKTSLGFHENFSNQSIPPNVYWSF